MTVSIVKWLCSSLQSLSSTVSSIESLGAPSTLKLPLWDKASAEFCFAKSRELLTKPSAWTSYMDVEFDAHILDNTIAKKNLIKSTEFLENGHRRHAKYAEGAVDIDIKLNAKQSGRTSFYVEGSDLDFSRDSKRVSASYVDRYFEQPKYFDDNGSLECPIDRVLTHFNEDKLDKIDKINNLEEAGRNKSYVNFQEQGPLVNDRPCGLSLSKVSNSDEGTREKLTKFYSTREKVVNFESAHGSKLTKFDSPKDKLTNFDLGTRPKISSSLGDSSKMNITCELTKKFDLQKSGSGKVSFASRNSSQDANIVYDSSDNIKGNLKTLGPDSPRGNMEAVRINKQNFRKVEQNQSGHDNFPFVISNNPLFIAEPEQKESPIYSSSESLRVNFQRLRCKSDAEANNQVELSSKLFAEKYQREVSGLESVKNYLDSKKGQGLNLGLGKLTQNMIQLSKNIAQNSRNIETSVKSAIPNARNLDKPVQMETPPRSLNIPIEKPKHLDLNIPFKVKSQVNIKLNLTQKLNAPASPNIHQNILEPPKLYQNENIRKELIKSDMLPNKVQASTNPYRHRTSSLSENRKPPIRNVRRSLHSKNDSSEDSDSISHSETDIRSRLRYKRRHKKVPHNLRLNFKNKGHHLHPDSARGFPSAELCGKSPPPSTSFLNSLSPPFSSRNNLLSWPESAPSSSLTFTSNSDLDSDTSSDYPEFTNDTLNFPPSPAP